jgi:hypothetical protein
MLINFVINKDKKITFNGSTELFVGVMTLFEILILYTFGGRLCGLVVEFLSAKPEVPGSINGATTE